MKNIPPWQLIWMTSFFGCLIYYVVKTFIMMHPSTIADTFIMIYGMVSLVVYVYFFQGKNKRKE